MANHCVYETCPDCGAKSCARGCGDDQECTCSLETISARAKKRAAEVAEAERRLAESMPEGWF